MCSAPATLLTCSMWAATETGGVSGLRIRRRVDRRKLTDSVLNGGSVSAGEELGVEVDHDDSPVFGLEREERDRVENAG